MKWITQYIRGFLTGLLPLLFYILSVLFLNLAVDFLVHVHPKLALSLYSWIPIICVVIWGVELLLGIFRWQKASKFSLGIFTSLTLLLCISPGLYMAWAMGVVTIH